MLKKIQILLLLLLPMGMMAQFSLQGKITDKISGKSLAGATIILNTDIKSTSSDENGDYRFNRLKQGNYTIMVSFIGYETINESISISSSKSLDFKLEPKVYMGDEIIVTASRINNDLSNSITEVSYEKIKETNTGQDLPYLLSMTPSVVVSSDAGAGVGYTSMRIRGTDLTGISVTLNGVPVNDAESQTVYFVDLPDLASSVDNIQINRGVGSSANGSPSFGASINIKTDEFNTDPYAEWNSAFGSFNTLKTTLKFGSGLIKGGWNFNGRVSTIQSDGYIDRAKSDLKSAYLSGGYYGEKDVLKAVVILGKEKTYQAWYGIPKDSLETNPIYNPAGEIYDAEGNFMGYYDNQTDNYWQNYYQLHYIRKLNSKMNLTATGFYTRGYGYYENYKSDEDFYEYGMNDTVIGNDSITSSNMITQKWLDNHYYGANFSFLYDSYSLKFVVGGSWNRYDGDHYGKVIWSQIARLGDYDRNWYFNNGLKTETSVYAKAEYVLSKKLSLFADVQYRNIDYGIKGTHDDLRDISQNHNFNFLNPKFGLAYAINDANNISFSWALTHREPSRTAYRDANPAIEIRPEKLSDFELGYKFSASKFYLNANVFYMDYRDQLVLTGKINNVGSAIMENVDDSYRAGIELMTYWDIHKVFAWSANASLSTNKIKDYTAYVDDWDTWPTQREENFGQTDISFSPSVTANNNFIIRPFKGFELNLITNYVGKQYIDNTSNDNRSIDAYLLNNIRLNYGIETNFIEKIDFIVTLNNIFNESYAANAWVYRYYYDGAEYDMNGYFPQAGFNFMVGINLKF